jgi:hypothetical protein
MLIFLSFHNYLVKSMLNLLAWYWIANCRIVSLHI